jgi:hypothetical protein
MFSISFKLLALASKVLLLLSLAFLSLGLYIVIILSLRFLCNSLNFLVGNDVLKVALGENCSICNVNDFGFWL